MPLEFRGTHLEVLEDTRPQIDLEGARYSGKTYLICAKVILSCLKHPGIIWLVCRYSDDTTRKLLKPIFQRIAQMYGVELEWDEDASAFWFPTVNGKRSKVQVHGLRAQSIMDALSKVRGLDVAGVWNDQTEELPQAIAEELVFATRQSDYPHQVIFSPNPPSEDHFLTDMFPEENPSETRKYYRVSLYDNPFVPLDKLKEIEDAYPPTNARYKSLVLGMRGPNVVGTPIYGGDMSGAKGVFLRQTHIVPCAVDHSARILEGIDTGKHHPVWTAYQRTPTGIKALGGVMGKRMFLEDFLPWVDFYRQEWFGISPDVSLCCDPPPSDEGNGLRYTHVNILRAYGYNPVWRPSASAPDVRESVIQNIAGMMRRPGAFALNADPTRWVMVSPMTTKQTKLFADGLEGSYVWDEHLVSVGNKKVRQPKSDQWVDGWQRCLENTVLNFCAGQKTQDQADAEAQRIAKLLSAQGSGPKMPFGQGYLR